MKLIKTSIKVLDYVNNSFSAFSGFLVVFAAIAVCVGVITRSIGHPIGWIVEVTAFILFCICFLVAAWVLKKEGHVVIDVVIKRLSPRNQSMCHIVNSIICALICLVIFIDSTKVTRDYIISNETVVSVLEPPKWILFIVVPIGSFLLFFQFIKRTYDYLKQWKSPPESPVPKINLEL